MWEKMNFFRILDSTRSVGCVVMFVCATISRSAGIISNSSGGTKAVPPANASPNEYGFENKGFQVTNETICNNFWTLDLGKVVGHNIIIQVVWQIVWWIVADTVTDRGRTINFQRNYNLYADLLRWSAKGY